jgi:hypothetical protein
LLLLLPQGRLFVSARIVGFYANLFGHKTKFFFLWEDVEEIEVLQPSFTTVGTPSLLFILKSGRGLDAKSGAKSQDKEGRLKFQFHSFASFSKASRLSSLNCLFSHQYQYWDALTDELVCGKRNHLSIFSCLSQDNNWSVENEIVGH